LYFVSNHIAKVQQILEHSNKILEKYNKTTAFIDLNQLQMPNICQKYRFLVIISIRKMRYFNVCFSLSLYIIYIRWYGCNQIAPPLAVSVWAHTSHPHWLPLTTIGGFCVGFSLMISHTPLTRINPIPDNGVQAGAPQCGGGLA